MYGIENSSDAQVTIWSLSSQKLQNILSQLLLQIILDVFPTYFLGFLGL